MMTRKQYTLSRKLAEEVLTDSANSHEDSTTGDDEIEKNKIGSMTSKWYDFPRNEPLPNLEPLGESRNPVDKRLLKYYKLRN